MGRTVFEPKDVELLLVHSCCTWGMATLWLEFFMYFMPDCLSVP